jgi:hypothetical protein
MSKSIAEGTMNIREYKRNLMVVNDIDSDLICEAYFILKSGSEYESEERISEEAERIIRECSSEGKNKRRAGSTAFAVSFILVGIIFVAAIAVFALSHLTV